MTKLNDNITHHQITKYEKCPLSRTLFDMHMTEMISH